VSNAAFERITAALEKSGRTVKPEGEGKARSSCPAHDGDGMSLTVRNFPTRADVKCHSHGCDGADILAALGLSVAEKYHDVKGTAYTYTDPLGGLLRTVTRRYDPQGKRSFSQSIKDKKAAPTLYRLPRVLEAVKAGETVYLVEGEEDVHALEAAFGVTATTAPQGAANFHKADPSPLYGAHVVAVVDRDDPDPKTGKIAALKWAADVRTALADKAASLRFVYAADGKDATDHITAGRLLEDFHDADDLPDLEDEDLVLRRARITWANTIEPEPVVWAWTDNGHGRIPSGSLSIAAGREGTGKSSFGIWLAAHITRGTLPGSFHGKPRRVFYVAVEDSWKFTLVPRLMAAGADLARVGRFDMVTIDGDETTLSLPHDNRALEGQVLEHDAALVVIDPLMSVIGERIDTHKERETRSALDPLAKLADRTGCIILGIAHFNKGSGTDAASLITGSGAFKNVPRTVFGFARDDSDDTDQRVMSQVKNSLGRDSLPSLTYVIESADVETTKGTATTGRFTFTGESERSVSEVLRIAGRAEDPDDVSERDEAARFILEYLADCGGVAPARDVITAGRKAGFSEPTMKKARIKAKAASQRQGFGPGSSVEWSIDSPIGSIDSTLQTPAPMEPMAAPMSEHPTVATAPEATYRGFPVEADDRPQCRVCSRRMGKAEAERGTCTMCHRIAEAEAKAADDGRGSGPMLDVTA
jgi:hypothetical protein